MLEDVNSVGRLVEADFSSHDLISFIRGVVNAVGSTFFCLSLLFF